MLTFKVSKCLIELWTELDKSKPVDECFIKVISLISLCRIGRCDNVIPFRHLIGMYLFLGKELIESLTNILMSPVHFIQKDHSTIWIDYPCFKPYKNLRQASLIFSTDFCF